MQVTTTSADSGQIAIIDCAGRITLGEGSVAIRDAVTTALQAGAKDIILNLADVNYADSSGLGELVSAFTVTRNSGGSLVLVGLQKRLQDLLQITKLYTVFPIFDTVDAALAHLHSTNPAGPA